MSGSSPRVSVIMIFLDAKRFLEEAIASVFAQTFADWELLLVDDGSTDGSTAVARRYAARHPGRIRYLEHPGHVNRGMSASRNLGIHHARGEFIAFLDADDVYLPGKLARQVAILDAEPAAAMVYGASEHWHSWTGRLVDRYRDQKRRLGVQADTLVQPPALIPRYLSLEAHTPGICGFLARREAVLRVGGFEESFRGMFEDQAFFYKLCLDAPVFVESGSWDRYRQHPRSHSQLMRRLGQYRVDAPNNSYHAFLNWLERYLSEQRINDREVWQALHREVRPYRNRLVYGVAVALEPLTRLRRILRQRIGGRGRGSGFPRRHRRSQRHLEGG